MSSPTTSSPQNKTEPFPSYASEDGIAGREAAGSTKDANRRPSIVSRISKTPSTLRTRARTGSLSRAFLESNPPLGFMQASGELGSKIPTLPEIRNGAFADEGWTHEGQMEHRGTNPHEIHARRLARTSSASTKTRKSSMSANTPGVIAEERHEFFPKRAPTTILPEPVMEEQSSIQTPKPSHATAEAISQPDE